MPKYNQKQAVVIARENLESPVNETKPPAGCQVVEGNLRRQHI